jgi:NAD(P)-dependent dehydrogenase (short-subunit alcohol dehydrogenase family)
MLFSGKNIIVTGATGDLGVAIVQRLISQGANLLAVAGHQSEISRLANLLWPRCAGNKCRRRLRRQTFRRMAP